MRSPRLLSTRPYTSSSRKTTQLFIAHRLSTIKRSDRIICIDSEGRVAEEGTYEQLSSNPEGAFNKLMEWQMSGGEVPAKDVKAPQPTEEEEIQRELDEEKDEAIARKRG